MHLLAEMADDAEPDSPTLREIQGEALAALEATRTAGHRAGLVVMATGLGKTWLAAFDASRAEYPRVLFVAHREEILTQARDVFRRVRPDARLGFFTATEKAVDADIVFATVQTLHRHLGSFPAGTFQYVVVDEFHHASASTYRRVLTHFEPLFLLGLTATPDRMDGADLLALCGDNLVYRCDLVDGIERRELAPFRYWGVADTVDFAPIPWRNGRFDPDALEVAVATTERGDAAHREWLARAGHRTLAFCTSIRHAEFMAKHFRDLGVTAIALHSASVSGLRTRAVDQLERGDLQVLFTVDLFNEGVDLPTLDTILMLRPTESPVVFLQQLGRGLRVALGKEHLVVVDFVGNHRAFLAPLRTLISLRLGRTPTAEELLLALRNGTLPALLNEVGTVTGPPVPR
jgi:superfamily II DNA or RNA helicase